MKSRFLILLAALVGLACFWMMGACGDDDDDNDSGGAGGGVCYYECIEFTNTSIRQTFCRGESGLGNLATDALQSDSACEDFGRAACEESGYEFSQYYFDTACVSCDDAACEPDWLAEY